MRVARSRIVVVAWDLAHNGASCAFVLADLLRRQHDVEIIGPTFLGSEIWKPIRGTDIPIRTFPGRMLPQFVEDAERFVSSVKADVIYASKPRFPTLLLSMLIKDQCGAPVILHIDDLELGLVDATDAISLGELERQRGSPDLSHPTRAACGCLHATASPVMRIRSRSPANRCNGVTAGLCWGSRVTRRGFDPARVDQQVVRAEFGYSKQDLVVLFLAPPAATRASSSSPRRLPRSTIRGSSFV